MAIEPGIYKTPYQKIFTDKQDLGLFLLKIIELLATKKIYVSKRDLALYPSTYPNYIRVYTKEDALANSALINPIEGTDADKERKSLQLSHSIKLQTTETAEFLKNYFNTRIFLGFDTRPADPEDPEAPHTKIEHDLFKNSDSSKIFLFCYLQIFRYKSTWRTVITRGNFSDITENNDQLKYNIIAQDILSDYFQRGLYKSYISSKRSYQY